ncbi:MAG: fibronectin type III-like domain-contianing protein [Thermofilum sp.]
MKLSGGEVVVRLKVRNSGRYPGKEVVQVYLRALESKFSRPFQELKGFRKTKLLAPGEEESVEVRVPLERLATFSGGKWVVEKGSYEVRVGASSRDIRLRAVLEIPAEACYDTSWRELPRCFTSSTLWRTSTGKLP